MTNVLVSLALALSLAAPEVAASQSQPQGRDARSRDVFVSVVDAKGAPVSGLAAADFAVREDGVAREVLKAVPATEPMQIALLVDDSQAAAASIQPLREGIAAFIEKLAGKGEISIVTIGERPTSIVNYTSSTAELQKGVGRIFSRPGSGAYLMEGIIEVSRGLQKRKATRPVIVALTFDGVEFSNQQYQQVLDPLAASGATLHVLEIGTPPANQNDEMRNRNIVIAEGTSRSGGRRDQLLTNMAIPDKMRQLADELVSQYVVTYARPDTLIPAEKLAVTVTKPGLTARARTRMAAK